MYELDIAGIRPGMSRNKDEKTALFRPDYLHGQPEKQIVSPVSKERITDTCDISGGKMGWLVRPAGSQHGARRWQHRRRVKGSLLRIYRFKGAQPLAAGEEEAKTSGSHPQTPEKLPTDSFYARGTYNSGGSHSKQGKSGKGCHPPSVFPV